MAIVVFYEKSGCTGNARQKALLEAAGHIVAARDLPVADWFNRSAPAVKNGDIVPEVLDHQMALSLLLTDPLLIRRPLLEVGDERRVGFDAAAVHAWIGLGDAPPAGNLEACVQPDRARGCPDPLAF